MPRRRQCIQERFHRVGRAVVIEIDVCGQWEADHLLRLVGELEQLFPEHDRHDGVTFAVQDEQRNFYAPDALIRPKGILDEPADRSEWIGGSSDIGRRCKWRIEDEAANLAL